MSKTIICYHAGCPDGFGSAWAFYHKYKDDALYVPFRYGDKLESYEDCDVFFLDCSVKRDYLLEIKEKAKSVTVIDHHITAYDDIGDLDFCHFDLKHSGCVLSWKYLFPDKEIPIILQHIEDRDLWSWKLENSEEILSYLDSFDKTIGDWVLIEKMLNSDKGYDKVVESGKAILRYKNTIIKKISKNSRDIKICGYNGIAINSPFFQSEIGDLYPEYDFVLIYYSKRNQYICSLRTSHDNVDVSEIAKKFNGGGHKKASGFTIKELTPFFNN